MTGCNEGICRRIRDKLVQDWQTVNCRYEAERDNSGRLQLLLDAQKDTAESLQVALRLLFI